MSDVARELLRHLEAQQRRASWWARLGEEHVISLACSERALGYGSAPISVSGGEGGASEEAAYYIRAYDTVAHHFSSSGLACCTTPDCWCASPWQVRNGRDYCLKEISLEAFSEGEREQAEQEVQVLRSLDHPGTRCALRVAPQLHFDV